MANVTYTLADLQAVALNATGITSAGGEFDTGNASTDLVNDAIQQLAGEHAWSWLRKALILDFALVAITSIVRAANVLTITKTAHGLLAGDFIRLTGTTSADGEYYVAGVTSSSVFTINQTGSDETLAAPGSFITGFVNLPSDFVGLLVLERNSTIRTVFTADFARITRNRSGAFSIGPFGFLYCIRTAPQISAGVTTTKRLELWPTPTESETAALVGEYRRAVPKLTGGTNVADIGLECFGALRRLCRALAISTEEERAGEDWRVYERLLGDAKLKDGDEQPNLGQMKELEQPDGYSSMDAHLYPLNIGAS